MDADADQPSAPPPSMFGAPFKAPAPAPHAPVAAPKAADPPAAAPGSGPAVPAPPPRVWLSGSRGNMPVHPPAPTAFHAAGQAPSAAEPRPRGGQSAAEAPPAANSQPGGAIEGDRRWFALEDGRPGAHGPTPVQRSEAEMGEMRMQALMDENKTLRAALRMDQKMPVEALQQKASSDGMFENLRDMGTLNQHQRDEINRLRKELEQTASKLSKAEGNVDRKLEMVQILRAQLDEADRKASQKGPDNEERMRMQESLMQSQAQIEALRQELDKERKLKEDAWERLLKVDPEKYQRLEAELQDEKLNMQEMLGEIRGLRAEKDAAAAEAARMINALTAERNALKGQVQDARSDRDSQLDALQHERVDALEKLQNLREDYASLDAQVNQSKTDNQALMAQLKFLTQQLQAKQVPPSPGEQPVSILKTSTQRGIESKPTVPWNGGEDGVKDPDEQARFYEQQILMQQQSPSRVPQYPQTVPQQQQQQQQPPQIPVQMSPAQLFSPNMQAPMPAAQLFQAMPTNAHPQTAFGSAQPQRPPAPQQMNPAVPISMQQQQHQQQGQLMPRLKPAHSPLTPLQSTPQQQMMPQQLVPTQVTPSQMHHQTVPQMNQQATPQSSQQMVPQTMTPQQTWPPMQMTPVAAPPNQSVALLELTADQVQQAGFDPNSVIGV